MARVALFVLMVTMAACSRSPQNSPAAGATAPGQPATPAGAPPGSPAPVKPVPADLPNVLARVNDFAISKTDFERAIHNAETRAGSPVPSAQRDQVFRRVLDELIGYRLLVQETEKRHVAVDDKDVEAQIGRLRQQFPSEDAFTKALAQQKLTLDQVRADARQQLEINKMLEAEVGPKAAVTPDQVSAFYKEHPESFQTPEQVRASHILIRVQQGADAAAKAAARAKAEKVLKSARAGKDFAALAKEYSEDPGSAASGGDLGVFRPGQMVGPFNDAAFKLKPGTISDIVETDFGYHIIKVVEKIPARPVTLDEARPQIQQALEQENKRRETQAFVQALRTKGKVEVFI